MHINVQTRQMRPWQGVLFGLIFTTVGIALLCFAVSTIKSYNEKNETFIETSSKVIDYKYNDDGLKAIVVEYVVDGQTYQKISNSYSNMPKGIGTEVSVKYNPNNPKDAIWTSDSTNAILPIVGILFTLVGVIVIIFSVKNGKKQKQLEEQTFKQSNGLYSNIDVESQINNVNQEETQPMNNVSESQMNNFNQPSSSVDINNQNNNINTNM